MEVRIRLQKAGKSTKKRYHYRIVAIARASAREGRNLGILGYYDPSKKPTLISVNCEKLDDWVKKGAQMSYTIKRLLKKG